MREMLSPYFGAHGQRLGKDVALITMEDFRWQPRFVVGHIAPEAFVGGPIAIIRKATQSKIDASSVKSHWMSLERN